MGGPTPVVEAGVILRDLRADGTYCTYYLVIRRLDDWELPHGRREAGEDVVRTALRTLGQEAGARCSLEGPAGVFTYETDDERRFIHFFIGRYAGPTVPDSGPDGVTETRWLRRDEAAAQLTRVDLRDYFVATTATAAGRRTGVLTRPVRDIRLDRLLSAIAVIEVEVDAARASSAADPAAARSWRPSVDRLLDLAAECAAARRIDAGWEALHAAKRLSFHELSPEELAAKGSVLRAEADAKLGGWRLDAVKRLLSSSHHDHPLPAVAAAASILDEQSSNTYLKLRLGRTALPIAAGLLTLIVVALGVCVGIDVFDALGVEDDAFVLTDLGVFLGVVVLGAFGAMLSLALDREGASLAKRRIYEVASAKVAVPLARVMIGGASGVVVVAVVQVSVTDLDQAWAVLAAIPGGFSERLVRRSVEALDAGASGA